MMGLKIGEVAERGGVNLETIRYYEREGLLPKPPRLLPGTACSLKVRCPAFGS